MEPACDDPILDEWFPVAAKREVSPGAVLPFVLLGRRFVLLCDGHGEVFVLADTCPHRGAQLSLGHFDGAEIQCPYHGWRFRPDGTCVFRPAHPDVPVPAACSLRPVRSAEAYDLWWVCLGDSPRGLPSYPAHGAAPGRTSVIGPKRLHACGPRIVENFLDIAHFPFVHAGYLGVPEHARYREHELSESDAAVVATNVVVWQPAPGPTATVGGEVRYEYLVDHPYAARLTKIPSAQDGGEGAAFSLLVAVSPETEHRCRVWMLTTVPNPDADLASYDAFNETILGQDVAVVESQLPKRLPLDPRQEVHQRADRVSLAYRRWLSERGVRYGTSANDSFLRDDLEDPDRP